MYIDADGVSGYRHRADTDEGADTGIRYSLYRYRYKIQIQIQIQDTDQIQVRVQVHRRILHVGEAVGFMDKARDRYSRDVY